MFNTITTFVLSRSRVLDAMTGQTRRRARPPPPRPNSTSRRRRAIARATMRARLISALAAVVIVLTVTLTTTLLLIRKDGALDNAQCATTSTATGNFFPSSARLSANATTTGSATALVEPSVAFSVTYDNTFKVVRTLAHSTGVPAKTYVLYQCGTTAPSVDADGTAFASGTQFFSVPVTKMATGLTIAIGFIEELGLRSKVSVVDPGSVHAPCWQEDEETGDMKGVDAYADFNYPLGAYDPSAAWTTATTDLDLVITDRWNVAASGTTKDVNFDASEAPLGMLDRLEYVKFLSLFYNMEKEANAYYADQVSRWEYMRDRITYAQSKNKIASSYTCAWVADQSYTYKGSDGNDVSVVSFVVSFAQFEKDICTGVGLTTFVPSAATSGATTYSYSSMADFHAAIANVNVIFDKTYYGTPSTTTKAIVYAKLGFDQPSASSIKALSSEGTILRMDKRVSDADPLVTHSNAAEGLDWFESSFAHPALVLSDLSRLVWLDTVDGIDAPQAGCPRFFRDIKADDTVVKTTAADCPVYDAARTSGTCDKQLDEQRVTLDKLYGYSASASVSVTVSLLVAFAMALMT